ncbi:MAG: DNA polymerase III subunit alpha, partial [Candidatus Sericytochromatia bacterium]|nr:DNA polymerase III subunit alpha [Candidatus Sericytochromatia bacterium]
MKHEFVHCHVHSEFSLLDGSSRVKDIVKTAVETGMTAIALTDHNVMYGAIDFYKKAKSADIKPIIGYEAFVSNNPIAEKKSKDVSNIVLLAKNEKGYKNIIKLVSTGFLEGFYYYPRIDYELLAKYSEGVIALSSCLNGEVSSSLLRGNYDNAFRAASHYKEIFGDDYYIEIQDHGMAAQKRINPNIVRLSKELEIKLVATNDCHYTKREDALAREILTCIKNGIKLEDNKNTLEGQEHYIKSPDEMYQIFHEIPEALKHSLEIADKCNLSLHFGDYILPHFPLPPGHTADTFLNKLSKEGLKHRYKELNSIILKRFDYEISMIHKMGFSAYFLIVADYISFARKKGIQVGPGRGSAAGSIVAYALGITDIDPLPFNLLFERFLNPERISMPDVDTDFCIDRRAEVIQYVSEKYGASNVSQIVTLGTLGAKQVLRDVSKVMGYAVSESEKLSKMIPKGVGIKLADALVEGLDLYKACEENPRTKEIIELAKKLEGLARHSSIHAAGIVISKDPLDTIVPLEKNKDGVIIAQYQMSELEKLGLLKMDFLGLRNLTMIANALEIIENTRGFVLDLNEIPLDDQKTYELLESGNTIGVFQLESSGMQKLVMELKPNVFEEIIALIALYRPGPLGSGMVESFVNRKHGREPIEYPHPTIEDILKDTYGLIVYQEQIMQISQIIAGYSLGQADLLRKAMGKKLLDEMQRQRETFMNGAAKNGVDSEIAKTLFDTMEKFAEYGFNKSHSAAYAVITYRTAYLKANYPVEYMAALISSVMNNPDKVPIYTSETRRMGIQVLQPDVNSSENNFKVDAISIRFGLKAVKGVGENVIAAICETRKKNGHFKSLYDFCKSISSGILNRKAIESLIKAGGFDSVNTNRRQLLEGMELTYNTAIKKQKDEEAGQTSMFGMVTEEAGEVFDEAPELPNVEPYPEEENLAIEKQVLGLYVSGHPLNKYSTQLERFCIQTTSQLGELNDGVSLTIGGIISNYRTMLTKKMDTMAVFTLEDLTGTFEVIAYPEAWNKYRDFLANDSKLLLHGKLNVRDEDTKVILSSVSHLSSIPYLEIKVFDDTSM